MGQFVISSDGKDYIPQERKYFPALQRGDSVGGIYEKCNDDGTKSWYLLEDKISKVSQTKEGWKYYTKSNFRPLYAEEVDSNTKAMEDAIGKGYIITKEVFGLNDKTRPFAERWVEWANNNKDKAVSILDADLDQEEIER